MIELSIFLTIILMFSFLVSFCFVWLAQVVFWMGEVVNNMGQSIVNWSKTIKSKAGSLKNSGHRGTETLLNICTLGIYGLVTSWKARKAAKPLNEKALSQASKEMSKLRQHIAQLEADKQSLSEKLAQAEFALANDQLF